MSGHGEFYERLREREREKEWGDAELGENYLHGTLYAGRLARVQESQFNMAFFEADNPRPYGASMKLVRGRNYNEGIWIQGEGEEIRDNILTAAQKLGAVPSLGAKLAGLFNIKSDAQSMPTDLKLMVELDDGKYFDADLKGNQPSNFEVIPRSRPRGLHNSRFGQS